MGFSELGLSEDVLRAVTDAGYSEPTPIQEQAIPYILMGRDIFGCAQTGTGKTASFTLPMIEILAAGRAKARMPRSLILEPTRELAAQVAENFETYGKYHRLAKVLLIGGESMADQLKVLERGVDVLIATPGRLLDVFDRGYLLMNDVRILVIDEADRMLDMGFIPDVERIIGLVSRMRQTLLFSATMPREIRRLAEAFLTNPKEIMVSPSATPAATVAQALLVVDDHSTAEPRGAHRAKRAALRQLIREKGLASGLIFCNRKRDIGVLQRSLSRRGFDAAMLHGDMAQSARSEVLARFKEGKVPFLVCSDVAARGLDITSFDAVVNFDVPSNPEDYVHRIGRTGRAGRQGRAFTVATPQDGKYVQAIEQLIGTAIPRIRIEGLDAGELALPSRRGRGRKGRGRGPERVEAAAPPRATPAIADADRHRRQKPERRPPERREREPEEPVVGMGDHVPAFLLRAPTPEAKPRGKRQKELA